MTRLRYSKGVFAALERRIDRDLDAANAAGKLDWFNHAFRDARLRGRKLSYRTARIRLRNAILRRFMHGEPMGGLAREVFGSAEIESI